MQNLFSRVLIAIDGSQPSERALALGLRLAKEHDGEVIFCHALDVVRVVAAEKAGESLNAELLTQQLEEQAHGLLRRATQAAQSAGIRSVAHIGSDDPANATLDIAKAHRASVILIGRHGSKASGRTFLGSAAESVLRLSLLPVMVVPGDLPDGVRAQRAVARIVVGVDGSAASEAAIGVVLGLPAEDRRQLAFCSVLDVQSVVGTYPLHAQFIRDELRAAAEAIVQRAVAGAHERGAAAEGVAAEGRAADVLLAIADERRADLCVIGSHGRAGLQRFFLGSTAASVVRRAKMPVLVVRCAAP